MSGSTVANALLILTILIASEVSSAPREEMSRDSRAEKFAETREAEVRQSRSNENVVETREDELRQRRTRMASVKEPLPSGNETKAEATTKPNAAVKNDNATSEADDMSRTIATPPDDRANSTEASTNLATNINNTKPAANVEAVENSTGNATVSSLPPKFFPSGGFITPSGEKNKELYMYISHGGSSNATSSKLSTTKTAVDIVPMTTASNTSTIYTTISVPTEVTTEKPTTTSSTTQSPVTKKATEASTMSTTTEPTTATTPNSPKSEVITVSTTIFASTQPSKEYMELHSKKVAPMPSGVVALITAIAFAIVAVMAYVGLVAWRRYLEWRYGNRELLVNDFDANDIGNFEL